MSDEIKLVTRQETFNDLAVREIAKSKAACICRLQFGRCSRSQCSSCAVSERYNNCVSLMNDYDRLRLDSYISSEYSILSMSPDNWRSHRSYVLHYIGFVAVILLFLMLLFVPAYIVTGPFDKPVKNYADYNSKIISVMKLNQVKPDDINKDGLINCIDYTLNFKLNWDEMYPDLSDRCQIVRNRNYSTGMNHLFIMVGDIFVEPWAWSPYHYSMQSNWDDTYNPKYNIFGETERWLKEVKIDKP